MTIAKVQHYVPQFLLRNFGNGKKDQVWVYDKSTDRAFPTNTKNVASESRFYDFEVDGEERSLEPWLGQVESRAHRIVTALLAADAIRSLDQVQRQDFAAFLAVQLVRTKTFREQWSDFPKMLRAKLAEAGDVVEPGSQAEGLIRDISENQTKEETARLIYEAPEAYSDFFLDKEWFLIATTRKEPFMLSDNPLARQNLFETPGRGNLGLRSPGIEIYMPLSPTRALAMWCPTITEMVHQAAAAAQMASTSVDTDPFGPLAMSNALLSGAPVHYAPANVENFNSLQVVWSERYVFASSNDFEVAKSMTQEHDHFKRGPRMATA